MCGTFREDWMCDAKAIGLDGHQVMRCKLTFTPDRIARPSMRDIYKKLPTAVETKLRNPHIDQVFGGCFGRCVRFLATNPRPPPQMLQKVDILGILAKRKTRIIFSKKRTFAMGPSDVAESSGVCLIRTACDIRETELTPPTRRDFTT